MNSNVCSEAALAMMPIMTRGSEDQVADKTKGMAFAALLGQEVLNQDRPLGEGENLFAGFDSLPPRMRGQSQSAETQDIEAVLPTEEQQSGLDENACTEMLLGIQIPVAQDQALETMQETESGDGGRSVEVEDFNVGNIAEGTKHETLGRDISLVASEVEKPPDKVERIHLMQQVFRLEQSSDRKETKELPPGQWTMIREQSLKTGSGKTPKEPVDERIVSLEPVKQKEIPLQKLITPELNTVRGEAESSLEFQVKSGEPVTEADLVPDRNQIVQQMVKSFEGAKWDKGEYLRVRLQPEYLGELRIDIQKTEAGCIARISAQKDSVKKVLTPRIEEISSVLSERMIKVDQIIVDTLRLEATESQMMQEFDQSGLMQQNLADGEAQARHDGREQSSVSRYGAETSEEEESQEDGGTGINIVV